MNEISAKVKAARVEAMSASSLPAATAGSPLTERNAFSHTPFYCEENIYLLCKKLCTSGFTAVAGVELFVVFISNDRKQVPLWHQKVSQFTDGFVVWDYHVICVQKIRETNNPDLVWDLDSTLPFPVSLTQYMLEAIQPLAGLKQSFCRLFRVVHAPLFLRHFASDRRHMKSSDGNWLALPPTYSPIVADDGTVNNLDRYMTIQEAEVVPGLDDALHNVFLQPLGVVISEAQLTEFFARIPLNVLKSNQDQRPAVD